jgi:hypothetical protein
LEPGLGYFFIDQNIDFGGFSETKNNVFEFVFISGDYFVFGEAFLLIKMDGDAAMFEGVEFLFVEIFQDFALVGVVGFDFGGGSLGLLGEGLFGLFECIVKHVTDGH